MTIVTSPQYRKEFDALLAEYSAIDLAGTKNFKMYLDTVIINIATKLEKYKPSRYIDRPMVKEIDQQGHIITFFYNEEKDEYVLLSIVKKQD